ncbi:MAG TPA: glycosyltransferase [Kofleriaceae bacterium]|nr:glycosyltransferase [Kofleriaceae bacterium]
MARRRIAHVITGLAPDGAQQMLLKLVSHIDRGRFETVVVSLLEPAEGSIRRELEAEGAAVFDLGLRRALPDPRALARLGRILSRFRPDLIQGWMYHGNLVASAGRLLCRRARLLWNIRHSIYSLADEKLQTRQVIRMGARLSRSPDRIIYCARVSAAQHARLGYRAARSVVIPNGFDVSRFAPSAEARSELRLSLGIPAGARVVGNVGRYHPLKDHDNFLRAAALVAARDPGAHFVMVGRGLEPGNQTVTAAIGRLGLHGRAHLLGERDDVPRLMPGFDLYCLASIAEGFPNVLGEAMASGVPCVTTEVGAAGEIVDGIGEAVPPRDPQALAVGMLRLLGQSGEQLRERGQRSRQRVLERYALSGVVSRYEAIYDAL